MCGFSGYIDLKGNVSNVVLKKMNESLNHRGPDSSGLWINKSNTFGFSHNRLSIIDTSKNGSQPMFSHSNRFIICFNGEIYNHNELRKKLKSEKNFNQYNGSSDTETIINCFEFFGIDLTLDLMEGMFALALYDKINNLLILARDRFGEKPLYYGTNNSIFYFSSELKAIKNHPNFNPKINYSAVNQLLKYSYIEAPHSIYQGIYKLMPGNYIVKNLNSLTGNDKLIKYWDIKQEVLKGINNPFVGSENEALQTLDMKLNKAVKSRMISDVPIGSFLSGGIDSSLVTSLMQVNSNKKINTFSIGFNEDFYDEAKYAKMISNHLNTNHTELYVSSKDIIDVIPKLPKIYDEPFADSSQLPTYIVSELASKKVKVCLTGDAGDEVFGGYNRYIQANRFLKYPSLFKSLINSILLSLSKKCFISLYNTFNILLPNNLKSSNPVTHYEKLTKILKLSGEWDIYSHLLNTGFTKNITLKTNELKSNKKEFFNSLSSNSSFIDRMMFTDTNTYLCDDILCKVDRASMYNSLETRVPFLDREVFNFAWQFSSKFKMKNSSNKYMLKKVLEKYIPNKLIDRPKMGFGVPIDNWLRGPLNNWVEELIDEKKIKQDGILDYNKINEIWIKHKSKKYNMQTELWNILMFLSWQKEYY